jgi:hypothetical protein
MKLKITLVLCLILFSCCYAQDGSKTSKELDADELVSDAAFKELLFQDLNFLILGDNAPAQGISTELTDGSSQLSVKGLVKTSTNWLLTVDGNFAVDEGIYFFDEDNGSKQANFAVNFFYASRYSRNFSSGNTPAVQRALVNRNYIIKDTIYKSYEKFYKLHDLMKAVKLPVDSLYTDQHVIEKHEKNTEIINNKSVYTSVTDTSDLINLVKEFKLEATKNETSYDVKFLITNIKYNQTQNNKLTELPVELELSIDSITVNPIKLIAMYEKTLKELKALSDTIKEMELKNGEGKWTSKKIIYYGISPYYQRESLTIFNYMDGVGFDQFFNDTRGDLYGLNASLNWFYQSKNWLVYIRGLAGVGRGSNISSFKKRTYVFDDAIGNGTSVANEKVGYTNGRGESYEYGTTTSAMIEAYGTWKNIGLFGQLGYNNLNFKDDKNIKNIERYPFRAGILFNLKSTDKTKNLLTLQIFADRSDVSIDPTPADPTKAGDWRFGFKIGLPINTKSEL